MQSIKRILIGSLLSSFLLCNFLLGLVAWNDDLAGEGMISRWRSYNSYSSQRGVERHHRGLAVPKLDTSHPFMMKSHPDLTPIVVPEFKLIMITIPKVGCTEWNRLARVMMGHEDDLEQGLNHIPEVNGLRYISDYPLEEAESMLLDKRWTKAIFVRDPMERLLSAYLNKANHNEYFSKVCCVPYLEDGTEEGREEYDFCVKYKGNFNYFLLRTDDCPNMHWSHQYKAVGQKWWPYIDFVGNMDRAEEDARTLLESLTSDQDGMTAWEKYGKTGWGGGDRTKAFLETDTAPHKTGSKSRLRTFYTRCAEAFVKDRWAGDYDSLYFKFHPIKLFHPQADLATCNFTMETFKENVAKFEAAGLT